jgi:hypothetical protein
MDYNSWILKNHPLHISTYRKISYKIKTLKGNEKQLINEGRNLNV